MKLNEETLEFLDWIESTEFWTETDLHWVDIQTGDMLHELGVQPEQFAALVVAIGSRIREIIFDNTDEEDDDSEAPQVIVDLSEFLIELAIKAAVVTRQERGKTPIWQVPA